MGDSSHNSQKQKSGVCAEAHDEWVFNRVLKNSEKHLQVPRHTGKSRCPEQVPNGESGTYWIPAFAGMTKLDHLPNFSTSC
jgi:hypothetical protein